jgi:hypothetical protein
MVKEYYDEQGYDTDIVNNFYYDETNNFIKFQFRNNKMLNINNFLQKYRLGGITLDKNDDDIVLWNNLLKNLNIRGELKFKQVNTGKTDTFINCLRGKKLNKILEFIYDNDIYLHCYTFDNLYDVIIEIIDSLLLDKYKESYCYFSQIMKDELYFFVKTDVKRFMCILKEANYPNITRNYIKLFCRRMCNWINEIDNDNIIGLETCRQLFKEYSKKEQLIFLENNSEKVIIDGYSGLNLDMCIKFDKSFHCFDEISEIQNQLKNIDISNYNFENSTKNIRLQLSDVIIGFLNKFFNFLDQNSYQDIVYLLENMSDFQKNNLVLFLKLYKKSVDKNEMFMCFYEPKRLVIHRNQIIIQLINKYIQ